ncbi:E3 ubiquitin-protein ligase RNF5 [Cryptosporidium felis]|nr:E3 ubiquitin-protein ligase RNF5 [Cryptosporidium felis]
MKDTSSDIHSGVGTKPFKSREEQSDHTYNSSEQPKNLTTFECNICFENAHEPIVTRCGHLYCWSCISSWLDRGYGDCPVCKAGVDPENVIPLYGRGNESCDPRKKTKPRPKAERPEVRQRNPASERSRNFRNSELTFGVHNISLLTIFANPIGALLGLGFAQRFLIGEFPNNGTPANSKLTMCKLTNNNIFQGEEFRNQLISNILLLVGIVMMIYLLFIE